MMLCLSVFAEAGSLPIVKDSPLRSCFFFVSERAYDFTVDPKGKTQLYFKKKRSKERAGSDYIVKVKLEVEHKDRSGKVTRKKQDTDTFYVAVEPSLEQTEQSYVVEVTGGAKVQRSMKYDGERIILDAKVVDLGSYKEGDLSVVLNVVVPAMYPSSYSSADKKKLKDKMRRDKFKITRAADATVVSLKSYEEVDLASEEVAKAGFTSLHSKMGAQEGKELTVTSLSGKEPLSISSKQGGSNMLWKGYTVHWRAGGDLKKSPSPLVIQVK